MLISLDRELAVHDNTKKPRQPKRFRVTLAEVS